MAATREGADGDNLDPEWAPVEGMPSLVARQGAFDAARPTAMFDFDSTLAPFRGRGPPAELTIRVLRRLAESFNLVVISNRAAGSGDPLAPLQAYVAALEGAHCPQSDAPLRRQITVYASLARGRGRKPLTGAWDHLVAKRCAGRRPWFAFYCGDAAGRPGDHAATDYLFARNVGVPFTVPVALFGAAAAEPPLGGGPWTDPTSYGCAPSAAVEYALQDAATDEARARRARAQSELEAQAAERGVPCLCVLVGSPASGKSKLAAALAERHGIEIASADALGTAGCARAIERALAAGRSVVVDNTNPEASTRARLAARAQRALARHRIVLCHVATPKPACFHLAAARCQLDASGQTTDLPPVAIHAYWKRLDPPTEDEAKKIGAALVVVPFALAEGAPPEIAEWRYS